MVDNIATVQADNRSLKQGSLMAPDYAQQLWTETLKCDFVNSKKVLIGLFVDGPHQSICQKLRQLWLEDQHDSLKDLGKKPGSITDLQVNKLRTEELETVNKEERQKTYRNNGNRSLRGRRAAPSSTD